MKQASAFAPIRIKSLRDHVHDTLREAIITGKLPSGTKLNERQLASDLAVSTSPLKEALRLLESEGLVRTEPRKGSYVNFHPRQAEEMNLARAAIESIIARQAAKHGTEEHFQAMRDAIEKMRVAVDDADTQLLVALNERFHDTIHEASGCEYLRRLQSTQHLYHHAARITVLSREDVRRQSFAEHEQIMHAIISRDEDRAEQLMRTHIMTAGETHIELVFKQPMTGENA